MLDHDGGGAVRVPAVRVLGVRGRRGRAPDGDIGDDDVAAVRYEVEPLWFFDSQEELRLWRARGDLIWLSGGFV